MSRVELWLVPLSQPAAVVADLAELLDADERGRAESMTESVSQAEFTVTHGVLRTVVGAALARPPASLRWHYGPHGKPELAESDQDLRCNLSHSGDYAMIALTFGRAVGVDLQRGPTGIDLTRMAERYYPPDEAGWVAAAGSADEQLARYTALWTRKEACVKVTGDRLIPALAWPTAGDGVVEVGAPGGSCLVQNVSAPPGYFAAVALAGPAPFEVSQRWWPVPLTESPVTYDPLAVQR